MKRARASERDEYKKTLLLASNSAFSRTPTGSSTTPAHTMGTYAKAFEIPEDFPAILREFAKEAIREQPADIYR